MTTARRLSGESRFSSWLRNHPAIESNQAGLTVTDMDFLFHKYCTPVDRVGTRQVHCMMLVELKCYNRIPSSSQLETLYIHHQYMQRVRTCQRINRPPVQVWSFGAFVLRLPFGAPEDGRLFFWGQFGASGALQWQRCTVERLPELLAFTRRPDTLEPLALHRPPGTAPRVLQAPRPLEVR